MEMIHHYMHLPTRGIPIIIRPLPHAEAAAMPLAVVIAARETGREGTGTEAEGKDRKPTKQTRGRVQLRHR